MTRRYFSRERGLSKPADGLTTGEIPVGVRNAWINALSSANVASLSRTWRWMVADLDWDPSLFHDPSFPGSDRLNQRDFFAAIAKRPYGDWLDMASSFFYCPPDGHPTRTTPRAFRDFLNERLLRHHSAYFMAEDGGMEELGSAVTEQSIVRARKILNSDSLAGPDRQFQDAILAFHKRPNPNLELAVSSALNAVEGTTRIALEDPLVKLGPGLKRVAEKHQVYGALFSAISSLYGYASQEGGRHGVVGQSKVTEPVAEYCLHQSAATIVLIARLEGWQLVEGVAAA